MVSEGSTYNRVGASIMTKFPQLFESLCAPFSQSEVKYRKQAGRELAYITARTAMNRLDEVLGPECWSDEYIPHEKSVMCRLTITLPDGTTLTKCDSGGYAGMQDEGDDEKSGYSDAFKRACVKFGVGRHLYGDGIPRFNVVRDVKVHPTQRELDREIVSTLDAAEMALTQEGEVVREMPVNNATILRHLYLWSIEKGFIPQDTPKPETLKASRNLLNELYDGSEDAIKNKILCEIGRYVAAKLTESAG